MLALWQHGTLSVTALFGLLQLDPGTLSPLLKRLGAAGLLRRVSAARRGGNIPAGIVERLGCRSMTLVATHGVLTRVIAASQRALAKPPSASVA
jgi:MarR family transcriptional regulator, organic hydroperoxide resistance regulator